MPFASTKGWAMSKSCRSISTSFEETELERYCITIQRTVHCWRLLQFLIGQ